MLLRRIPKYACGWGKLSPWLSDNQTSSVFCHSVLCDMGRRLIFLVMGGLPPDAELKAYYALPECTDSCPEYPIYTRNIQL